MAWLAMTIEPRSPIDDRVAVVGRLGGDADPEGAGGAAPVVDHHRLADALGEPLAVDARDDVGVAARRVRDDEANRTGREALRRGAAGGERRAGREDEREDSFHRAAPVFVQWSFKAARSAAPSSAAPRSPVSTTTRAMRPVKRKGDT